MDERVELLLHSARSPFVFRDFDPLSVPQSAMLFQVSSTDVMTYAMACVALAIAALLASVIPARRAPGVDPIAAVRGQ